jgi:serine/threonine-protein kinase
MSTGEVLPEAEERSLGRYTLRYCVGRGGMAAVHLAQLTSAQGFRKWVAIKTVDPEYARNPTFVRLFLHEARLAARINHPNVCTVFDFGEAEGTYFLAMEYLHGEALSSVAKRAWAGTGIPVHVAARIVADAARGLHAAHELRDEDGSPAGVVHRDVSPQNVFVLYDGVAKVVDFGIAKSREARESGAVLRGKLAYMAPEQIEGREVDRRADVWALGVVLWELSLGRRLFRRESDEQVAAAVLDEPIPAPRLVRAEYPHALEAVVMRALARDPDRRYATAAELARDLELFLAELGIPAGAADVAEFMRELFADRLAERDAMLRQGLADPFGALPREERTRTADVATVVDAPSARLGAAPRRVAWRAWLGWGATLGLIAGLCAIAGWTWRAASRVPPVPAPPPRTTIEPLFPAADAGSAPRANTVPDAGARPSPRRMEQGERRGFLALDAPPGVRVFEGGTLLGTTPLTRLPLAPGRHLLRVVPERGAARSLTVFITSGRVTTRSLR